MTSVVEPHWQTRRGFPKHLSCIFNDAMRTGQRGFTSKSWIVDQSLLRGGYTQVIGDQRLI